MYIIKILKNEFVLPYSIDLLTLMMMENLKKILWINLRI